MNLKYLRAGLGAVSLLAAAHVAQAETASFLPATSADLLSLMQGCEDDQCMSYVSGVIGGIAVYAILADRPSPFCSDSTLDASDIRDAIITTIETTPQIRDQHPALAVLTAFGRTWPCMSYTELPGVNTTDLQEGDAAALMASGGHALIQGNVDAGPDRTIMVFHDANCEHCRRFSAETDILAERGWKIMVFPVATTTEDSAGYGAVKIALRDISEAAVRAIHDHAPEGVADITLATKLAEESGLSSREVLTALAKSGAYEAIENNTSAFFALGATGTPAWIVGDRLYGGHLTADAIEKVTAHAETSDAAPSPDDQDDTDRSDSE